MTVVRFLVGGMNIVIDCLVRVLFKMAFIAHSYTTIAKFN
jgi:hypothetical protein